MRFFPFQEYVYLEVSDTYESLWQKTYEALAYIYTNYGKSFDYMLKVLHDVGWSEGAFQHYNLWVNGVFLCTTYMRIHCILKDEEKRPLVIPLTGKIFPSF